MLGKWRKNPVLPLTKWGENDIIILEIYVFILFIIPEMGL